MGFLPSPCTSSESRQSLSTPSSPAAISKHACYKRSQIPRLKKRALKSKSHSLSIDTANNPAPPTTTHSISNTIIRSTNISEPTPFTHLSESLPCSPTSTTTHILATPEWASPDLSCRSYLTSLTSSLNRTNSESDKSSNSSNTDFEPSSTLTDSEKSWSKRSLPSTNASSSFSYSFSLSCLGVPFNVKRQRKAKSHTRADDPASIAARNNESNASANGNTGNIPYNSYCSVCDGYRNFYQKSCDSTNIFMECEDCHSVTRRRSSSSNSLLSTNYISFPSIDDSSKTLERSTSNPTTTTTTSTNSFCIDTSLPIICLDKDETLGLSPLSPSKSVPISTGLQKFKKPFISSFSLPLASA